MWRLMLEFWRDICCCEDDHFSQELHVFSRTMPGVTLYELQQRVKVLAVYLEVTSYKLREGALVTVLH